MKIAIWKTSKKCLLIDFYEKWRKIFINEMPCWSVFLGNIIWIKYGSDGNSSAITDVSKSLSIALYWSRLWKKKSMWFVTIGSIKGWMGEQEYISIIFMKNVKNEKKPLYNEENGLYWPRVVSEAKPRRLQGVNIVRFPSYITVFSSF